MTCAVRENNKRARATFLLILYTHTHTNKHTHTHTHTRARAYTRKYAREHIQDDARARKNGAGIVAVFRPHTIQREMRFAALLPVTLRVMTAGTIAHRDRGRRITNASSSKRPDLHLLPGVVPRAVESLE